MSTLSALDDRRPPLAVRTEIVRGLPSAAWAVHRTAMEAQSRGEDVVVLSIGDPDLESPSVACSRLVEAVQTGDTHYCDAAGRMELRTTIAYQHRARTGHTVTSASVLPTHGAQGALFLASMCAFGPGDEVLLPEPTYLTYAPMVHAGGAHPVRVACTGSTFLPAILDHCTERTRGIVLSNPINPTGAMWTYADLEQLAALAVARGWWVLADEVYGELVFEPGFVRAACLPQWREHLLTIDSVSKPFAMTGWRLGWAVGPERMIAAMRDLSSSVVGSLSGFVQEGALAALQQHHSILPSLHATYKHRRDLLVRGLADLPGLRYTTPHAGIFLVVDVSGTGQTSQEFATALYAAERVSVLDASIFGQALDNHIRISFGASDATIQTACERIRRYVTQHMQMQGSQ